MSTPLLADITFTTEGIAVIAGLGGVLGGGLVAAVKLLFDRMVAAHESQIADLKSQLAAISARAEALQTTGDRLADLLERDTNKRRMSRGLEPFEVVPSVVAEHHSPPTGEQRAQAAAETLDKRAIAIEHAILADASPVTASVTPSVVTIEVAADPPPRIVETPAPVVPAEPIEEEAP